jgi:hypothetical protein
MANDVDTRRAEFTAAEPLWRAVEDACAGEAAVKAGKTTYLPRPNPSDKSSAADERYLQYLARAVYMNATGRTLQSLTGLAFKHWPQIERPEALAYLEDNADGAGVGLVGQAQLTLGHVLKTGRAGLLVDYPPVAAPVSRADQAAGNGQATIALYVPSAIINWRTEKRGGRVVLTLVVLVETASVPDAFGQMDIEQRRELRLTPGGYVVRLWQKLRNAASGQMEWVRTGELVPLDGNGRPWQEIPFTFVGAVNNDTGVDPAPLYDLAVLNLAHYRNSADYEESVYFTGQPQYWISGLDQQWVKLLEEKGVVVGSRAILPLPKDGAAGILQAQPNTLAKEAMGAKEQQMAALGARLLVPGEATQTAQKTRSDDATAHSVLSLACDNVSEAYVRAMAWAAQFMRVAGAVDFAINTDFTGATVDAQQLTAVVGAWQAGKIPDADGWAYLRSVGLIDAQKTDEEIKGEIESSSAGLALDAIDPLTGKPKPAPEPAAA